MNTTYIKHIMINIIKPSPRLNIRPPEALLASLPMKPMECGSGMWISECVIGSAAR